MLGDHRPVVPVESAHARSSVTRDRVGRAHRLHRSGRTLVATSDVAIAPRRPPLPRHRRRRRARLPRPSPLERGAWLILLHATASDRQWQAGDEHGMVVLRMLLLTRNMRCVRKQRPRLLAGIVVARSLVPRPAGARSVPRWGCRRRGRFAGNPRCCRSGRRRRAEAAFDAPTQETELAGCRTDAPPPIFPTRAHSIRCAWFTCCRPTATTSAWTSTATSGRPSRRPSTARGRDRRRPAAARQRWRPAGHWFAGLAASDASLRGSGGDTLETGFAFVRDRLERELVVLGLLASHKLYAIDYGGSPRLVAGAVHGRLTSWPRGSAGPRR